MSSSQYHLSDQYYDICIRRESGKCSVCFSPYIVSTSTSTASSYGLGAGSSGPAQTNAIGVACTGVTTQPAAAGLGDYIEIANLQPGTGTAATINPAANRMCGQFVSFPRTSLLAHVFQVSSLMPRLPHKLPRPPLALSPYLSKLASILMTR